MPVSLFCRRLVRGLLLACTPVLAFCASPPPFENTMAQRMLACTSCHGKEGRAGPDGYYPRIAGKPAAYLYHQLLNFREGRRHYAPMQRLLEPLSDAYLQDIARYFAGLDLPYPAPQPPAASAALLQQGQRLARQGDAARDLPACIHCHGAALTGMLPQTPGLLGLPRDYLNAQLGAWRTGQRRAHAPDCMAEIARKLSPDDLSAVTAWLATQPVPHPARPAQPPARPLPCGNAAATTVAPGAATDPAQQIARGALLARAGNCMGCHTDTARGGAPFAGGRALATPFGTLYAGNLTPDADTGLGRWTPADFWQALHHGRSRDGRLLYPAFPYPFYTWVTRADADALFAYLRSLPPVRQPPTAHALRWPYSTQAALAAWRALYFRPADAQASATLAADRGAYLVRGLGHCGACHAPHNALWGHADPADLSGGFMPLGDWYAPALTARAEAGVADWPLPEIVQLLRTGAAPRGSALGPMAEVVLHSTQHLPEADLQAMARYLQSLPAAPSRTGAAPPLTTPAAATPTHERGAKLYGTHCAQCHGKDGRGVAGAYPPLAGNRGVTLPTAANAVQAVLHGGFAPATQGNPQPFGMPPFALQLSDADIAAVLTFVRGAWSNRAPPVSEFEVSRLRGS